MAFQVESASLISLFVEALLHGLQTDVHGHEPRRTNVCSQLGLFLTVLILSCYIIKQRLCDSPETRAVNLKLSIVLGAMFILATIVRVFKRIRRTQSS